MDYKAAIRQNTQKDQLSFSELATIIAGLAGDEQNDGTMVIDGNNLDNIYSSINLMLENKKYLELGKNAKEFVNKFQWSKIIEDYKIILNS